MYITMDEKTHTYFVNGDIAKISVTELLHKHGLAPSYDEVDEEVLNAARERGKAIHADIEAYIKSVAVEKVGDYVPKTAEGLEFARWFDENWDGKGWAWSEQMIAYDYNGMIVAGSIDLYALLGGIAIMADYKGTSKYQKEYVSWQISLYDYMVRQLYGRSVNDVVLSSKGAERFMCFLFPKGKPMEIKEVDRVPDGEIEKLLDAEYNGEKYMRPALVLPDELSVEMENAERALIEIEEQAKAAKERADAVRAALLSEMQRQGIYSYETERLKVTYRAGYDKVTLDSTKLRRELPQVYEKYGRTTRVKPCVIITQKEEFDEGTE